MAGISPTIASHLTKWRLPAVSIAPKGFLIVFASGKDRGVAGAPLHTSFSLTAAGEYLALVLPDGTTVASALPQQFPEQFRDMSYGIGQWVTTNVFVAENAPARALVPVDGTLGNTWIQPGFNHNAWLAGPMGIGFETEVAGFAVHNYKANVSCDSLAAADGVIANPAQQVGHCLRERFASSITSTPAATATTATTVVPRSDHQRRCRGFRRRDHRDVTFPTAAPGRSASTATTVFACRRVVSDLVRQPARPADTFGTFNVPAAGDYPLRLVFYERGGGSESSCLPRRATGRRGTQPISGSWVTPRTAAWRCGRCRSRGVAVAACAQFIATDLEMAMRNRNATAYVRIPFNVSDPSRFESLTFRFRTTTVSSRTLNGDEIARRNSPTIPRGTRPPPPPGRRPLSLVFEDFNLSVDSAGCRRRPICSPFTDSTVRPRTRFPAPAAIGRVPGAVAGRSLFHPTDSRRAEREWRHRLHGHAAF